VPVGDDSPSTGDQIARLEAAVEQARKWKLEELGGTVLTLQSNAGANADRALEVLGNEVLPALKGARV
jgi:hypothetical protein